MTNHRQLNLGCGFDKRDDFLNVDGFVGCEPDLLMDIDTTPWPLESNAFDFILMKHVLEHVGESFDGFSAIMQEIYRILSPGGMIEIHVPHYRHDTFWADPTHVRAFNYLTFQMMSKKQNDIWIENRANYTMLAYVMEIDFEIEEALQVYDSQWVQKINDGVISKEKLQMLADHNWNVAKELHFKLRAVK